MDHRVFVRNPCKYGMRPNYFVACMLASLQSLDQSLFWVINGHHAACFDYFFSIITCLGTGWAVAPVVLVFIFKEVHAAKRIAVILFSLVILIASGLVNSHLKHSFRTSRPAALFAREQGAPATVQPIAARPLSVKSVHIVGERLLQNSFPSGHANTAFSTAMLMVLFLGRQFWPAFLVAALVGYSRVYMGAHFPSDVIGGALLGVAIVWIGFICYNQFYMKRKFYNDQQ
jgi:undecaprenyl-diphosphatase